MSTFLQGRLAKLKEKGTYRTLPGTVKGTDFWSNDYLGFAALRDRETAEPKQAGATGSRLISGDLDVYHQIEAGIAESHLAPAALVFNSGYTALLGLLSALLTRTDTIIYDELSHACCRDGIRLSPAKSYRFRHNDTLHLRARLKNLKSTGQVFVLTESRFSMDGDEAPLAELVSICEEAGAHLIVDEAHAGGLDGYKGAGLCVKHDLQDRIFARVITYGKAFGTHGAAVLGSEELRDYLINTARPFIYTTGMAQAQWVGIALAYKHIDLYHGREYERLRYNILHYQEAVSNRHLREIASRHDGPIQTISLPGNERVLTAENACREAGLLVKAIRHPTVPTSQERLRICLHSFNTHDEIDRLVTTLNEVVSTFAGQ